MDKRSNRKIKGIVFDMDGVIIDTCKLHEESWFEVSKEYDITWDKTVDFKRNVFGTCSVDSARLLFGQQILEYDINELCLKKEKIYKHLLHMNVNNIVVRGFSGFFKSLAQSGIPIALGTSSIFEEANFVLKSLDIARYFKTIIHFSKVKQPKPDPEVYIKACEELDALPQNCIGFEDSISGIIALERAGIRCVVVGTTLSYGRLTNSGLNFDSYIQDFNGISLRDILRNTSSKPLHMRYAI
ncbi:MAG: HAD family phosphatase [Bacillota bacterium]|nr:HAD family phosphatase [Bacillota bacterium]